jgi:GNAT superfamily N-acetyltransferase
MQASDALVIRPATPADVPLILALVRELADYEHLSHEVVADEATFHESLFGHRAGAEAVIAERGGAAAGFALYFHNFSTFLGRQGLYLEDLYVRPEHRGRAVGRALLVHLARLALQRRCGRFEWAVLDWNRPARDFYEALGARANPAWVNYRLTGDALQRLAAGDLIVPTSAAEGPACQ